jgi:hypothetical protein
MSERNKWFIEIRVWFGPEAGVSDIEKAAEILKDNIHDTFDDVSSLELPIKIQDVTYEIK